MRRRTKTAPAEHPGPHRPNRPTTHPPAHARTFATLGRAALAATLAIGLGGGSTGVVAGEAKSARDIDLGATLAGRLLIPIEDERGEVIRVGAPRGSVRLVDADTGRELAATSTEPDGRYRFEHLVPGAYTVCWTWQGVTEGCEETIELVRESRLLYPRVIADIRTIEGANFKEEIAKLLEAFRRTVPGGACINGNGFPRYLSLRRNDRSGAGGTAAVAAREKAIARGYYARIDRAGTRRTLGDWWRTNGFDPITGAPPPGTSADDAPSAAYLNHNDLGFGRNMQCLKRNASNIACWVSNHGRADQDSRNADLAARGIDPGATVTMEFSPLDTFTEIVWRPPVDVDVFRPVADPFERIERANAIGEASYDTLRTDDFVVPDTLFMPYSTAPTVKFYVYAPDPDIRGQKHADFARATGVDLDDCGEKQVPGLCLNCHGGNVPLEVAARAHRAEPGTPAVESTPWSTADAIAVGRASFREFDTGSFRYPGGRSTPNVAENVAMEKLNRLVQDTQPVGAIRTLIDGWYAGGSVTTLPGDVAFDHKYVPPSWDTWDLLSGEYAGDVYLDTVAKACRTCHVAFEGNLEFDDPANLRNRSGSLHSYLCGQSRSMPHAKITALNFTDAQRKRLLEHVTGSDCP